MQLRYGIVGVGGVGAYFGGRLANARKDVHFLYHSEYEWVREHGLRVDSVGGDFYLPSPCVYERPEEMPKCDVVLVAMKSTQNALLRELLKPLCHERTVIVLVQNGLGLERELSVDFPRQSIAGGMAFICTFRVGQGHICHADYGTLTVGFHQHPNEEVLMQMKSDFEQSSVPFYVANDLNLARWRKLVWNIPYNGLTVALETTTECLMRNPQTRKLVRDLMMETIEGAQANGADIREDFVEKMLISTDNMKPYSPSMKLDWDNHRKMEIRAIYDNPIKEAMIKGVRMRKVEMLSEMLHFKESGSI